MKRFLSAVVSAVLTVSSATAVLASAADEKQEKFVVLGDSIASGFGLADSEHNYGELVADYYGGSVKNFAHSGDETTDLIKLLEEPSAEMTSSLKDADYVLVSIGGNDLIHYASTYLLNVCANVNVLKSGYTKDDIPADPTLDDITRLIDKDALKAYASANPIPMNSTVQKLRTHIVGTKEKNKLYDCVIEQQVIPNIEKINADIKAVNPDAKIVYQTIYDPLQFDKDYYAATYTGNALTVMNLLIPVFTAVCDSYSSQLSSADLGGAPIADVYNDITSVDENGQKYGWYFTKIQEERDSMDIHPTQAGHVAIAAKIIDTIGTKTDGGDLIVKTFDSLSAKDSYPAAAYETYKKVADTTLPSAEGLKFGDPNNDGAVDAKDASFILAAYAKASTSGDNGMTAEQKTAANVNGDALVDAKDASAILSYYSYVSTGGDKELSEFLAK